jgi:hypothetical protein
VKVAPRSSLFLFETVSSIHGGGFVFVSTC